MLKSERRYAVIVSALLLGCGMLFCGCTSKHKQDETQREEERQRSIKQFENRIQNMAARFNAYQNWTDDLATDFLENVYSADIQNVTTGPIIISAEVGDVKRSKSGYILHLPPSLDAEVPVHWILEASTELGDQVMESTRTRYIEHIFAVQVDEIGKVPFTIDAYSVDEELVELNLDSNNSFVGIGVCLGVDLTQ